MLTSIIIPAYNHARYLPAAIASALAQTVPVEVIVVDDGSTDDVDLAMSQFLDDERVSYMKRPHEGVAAARNAGIDAASGDFLMFLDADDTIEPTKVELQIACMDDAAGWVLCDTRIVNVDGSTELASDRYDYAHKRLDGWLEPWLSVANFIPVHAPLIRRSALVLGDIRFPVDKDPEDWHFWHALAHQARCRYTPAILATYHKRRGGRNSTTPKAKQSRPGVNGPIILNLGCGNPDALSWHPMPGAVNLDKSLGWRFEHGLGEFGDTSVDGITISHALMYVDGPHWPTMFAEFSRVLRPGGVIRITEDDTGNPASRTYPMGWRGSDPAETLTNPVMMRRHLEAAGFTVHDCTAETTHFRDRSLLQDQHGGAPHCFYIEGVRECPVLLSPHSDDETLFAAFTIIRHRPRVVICFPSSGDYGDTDTRTQESREAVAILGGGDVEQWDGQAIEQRMRELDARLHPTIVFSPDMDASHPDHRAVAAAAAMVFGARVRWYHTYNDMGKVRAGEPVPFEAGWPARKRDALACYRTQRQHQRARVFFEQFDLAEYTPWLG